MLNRFSYYLVILSLIFVQVLFGINFPASKVIVSNVDPLAWSSIRFLLAGVGMLFITLICRRKHPLDLKVFLKAVFPLALFGLALGQVLFLEGLKYTTSVNSALMTTFIPVLTFIVVVIRKEEELTLFKVIGLILAFLGVSFVHDLGSITVGNSTAFGDALVFLGAMCFALYLSFGRKVFCKYDNMWTTTWMFFISGFALLPFNLNEVQLIIATEFETSFYYCALYSIIGATLLTYLINNWALKKAAAANVAVFIYLQPIVAGAIGYFYLGEDIKPRLIICSVVILSGFILLLSKPSKKSS